MSYSGTKKALLIGIDYFGANVGWNVCTNNAYAMADYLSTQGFAEENIMILTDNKDNDTIIPTFDNIVANMEWLVDDAQKGDDLWMYYCGIGAEADENMAETSGYDQCIFPLDFDSAGYISDSELYMELVYPIPDGCRMFSVFDCDYSGTMMDLPLFYNETNGQIEEIESADSNETAITVHEEITSADVFSLSACQEDQTLDGEVPGALTTHLLDLLENSAPQTYLSLLQNLVNKFQEDELEQVPMLCTSHLVDDTAAVFEP